MTRWNITCRLNKFFKTLILVVHFFLRKKSLQDCEVTFLLEIHDNSSLVVFKHLLTFHFSLKYVISRLSSEDRRFQSQLDYFNRVTFHWKCPNILRNSWVNPLKTYSRDLKFKHFWNKAWEFEGRGTEFAAKLPDEYLEMCCSERGWFTFSKVFL